MSLTFESFDFISKGAAEIADLRRRVYGDAEAWLSRFYWEYLEHPWRDKIDVLVARDSGRMVGCTTRLPFQLLLDGRTVQSYFSVNSMVDPACRGQGVMRRLYDLSFEKYPLLFSKNTTPAMYSLLMKLGYLPVEPNNDLVKILKPIVWLAGKTALGRRFLEAEAPRPVVAAAGCMVIDRFGGDFGNFWARVSRRINGAPVRSSEFVNWRYIRIPHRSYHCFKRLVRETESSVFVLRTRGRTGYIVDLIWDQESPDEPLASVLAATEILSRAGMVKAVCWCTNGVLRTALKRAGFHNSPDTPHFSVRARTGSELLRQGTTLHFMAADGDGDYL